MDFVSFGGASSSKSVVEIATRLQGTESSAALSSCSAASATRCASGTPSDVVPLGMAQLRDRSTDEPWAPLPLRHNVQKQCEQVNHYGSTTMGQPLGQ